MAQKGEFDKKKQAQAFGNLQGPDDDDDDMGMVDKNGNESGEEEFNQGLDDEEDDLSGEEQLQQKQHNQSDDEF